MQATSTKLRAPFPYFGGKGRIAHIVWQALGDVKHYIEPFFGSGVVLLARPDYDPTRHVETICDIDGFVCNVWRALQFAPDEVARWCDWPVNHCDLVARKSKLLENDGSLGEKLMSDPEYYDAKLAGYWVWAASCWIGSGLTFKCQIPNISNTGKGVHRVSMRNGQRPHLADTGKGVHKLSLRDVPDETADVRDPYATSIYSWFRQLSERLRHVRVVCGDWTRVCGGNWQDLHGKTVGIFFDPPYGVEDRDTDIYHHDSTGVAHAVKEWARERGKRENYRIVLAGYDEHQDLLDEGWRVYAWKAWSGYSNLGKHDTQGKRNRLRERLYFSPHCLPVDQSQDGLFASLNSGVNDNHPPCD